MRSRVPELRNALQAVVHTARRYPPGAAVVAALAVVMEGVLADSRDPTCLVRDMMIRRREKGDSRK